MIEKRHAPATERNCRPILDVIRNEFSTCHSVLEIGSGTGQHAVAFGAELGDLIWQTSDRDENHASIIAWLIEAELPNVRQPLSLDVLTAEMPPSSYDAVFSANTSHIMSFAAVEKMFRLEAVCCRKRGCSVCMAPSRKTASSTRRAMQNSIDRFAIVIRKWVFGIWKISIIWAWWVPCIE